MAIIEQTFLNTIKQLIEDIRKYGADRFNPSLNEMDRLLANIKQRLAWNQLGDLASLKKEEDIRAHEEILSVATIEMYQGLAQNPKMSDPDRKSIYGRVAELKRIHENLFHDGLYAFA